MILEERITELEERVADLERVAPRCGVGGCRVITQNMCEAHQRAYDEYRREHFHEAHNKYGRFSEQWLYSEWRREQGDA